MKKFVSTILLVVLMASMFSTFFAGLYSLTAIAAPQAPIKLYMVGDSTMQNYGSGDRPQTGWGETIGNYMNANVTVVNRASGGRSTKSFIDEGKWDAVKNLLAAGDYVIIQFGHNDQKSEVDLHTDPDTTYKENLTKFINDAKVKGATPIICTSVVRRSFSGLTLRSDLGDYPRAAKEAAAAAGVVSVDLNASTLATFQQFGVEGTKKIFLHGLAGEFPNYPNGVSDNSHFQTFGADLIARLFVRDLQSTASGLKDYLDPAKASQPIPTPEPTVPPTVTPKPSVLPTIGPDGTIYEENFESYSSVLDLAYLIQQGTDDRTAAAYGLVTVNGSKIAKVARTATTPKLIFNFDRPVRINDNALPADYLDPGHPGNSKTLQVEYDLIMVNSGTDRTGSVDIFQRKSNNSVSIASTIFFYGGKNYTGTPAAGTPTLTYGKPSAAGTSSIPSGFSSKYISNNFVDGTYKIKTLIPITNESGAYIGGQNNVSIYINNVLSEIVQAPFITTGGSTIDSIALKTTVSGSSISATSKGVGIDNIKVKIQDATVVPTAPPNTSTPSPTSTPTVPPTSGTKPTKAPLPVDDATTDLIYYEDFDDYSSVSETEFFSIPDSTIAPKVALVTVAPAANPDKYLSVSPGRGTYRKTFEPVPVAATGGASPGKNAKIVAEYSIARESGADLNQHYFAFGDAAERGLSSNKTKGLFLMAGNRGADTTAKWRYTNNFQSAAQGTLLISGDYAASSKEWQRIRYEMTITNETGSFITPKVDVYVGDTLVLNDVSALNNGSGDVIDCLDIWSMASGAKYYLDDVVVVVKKDADPAAGVKVSGYLSVGGATVTLVSGTGRSTKTDNNGYFEFTSVPAGTYSLIISKSNAITRNMLINVSTTDYVVATQNLKLKLYVGDLNGDGNINITDYVAFLGCYGTSSGDANYIASVDYDNNGIININDYVEFLGNYGANASSY